MTAGSFEVEQKFRLRDTARFQLALCAVGASEGGKSQQTDWYFDHPMHRFAETDEALRLRRCDARTWVTYKGPKLDQLTKTRQEIEVELAPGEAAASSFQALMQALGFRFVATVRKERHEFHVMWQEHMIHIALDELPNLGQFVELEETQVAESDLDAARQRVASLASHLGLKPEEGERRSYLELLLSR